VSDGRAPVVVTRSLTIARDVTFLRQAALLLPSAFLFGVLLFLLTHGHQDPCFGTYPFFENVQGGRLATASPEIRFLEQSLLFFVPAYAVVLLFILGVSLAESALFGARAPRARSAFGRVFGPVFTVLFLAGTVAVLFAGERIAGRLAPGVLVAPMLVALAPFAGAAAALLPAVALSLPLSLVAGRSSS
jgi:hypothetical protein